MSKFRIGNFFQSQGNKLIQRQLERKYGQQIGKVASNGSKAFQRQVGDTIVTTGLSWDNKVIAEVTKKGYELQGLTKKIKYNKHGDMVEVSHSRRATNFRNNVTENLETGEVKSKVLTYGVKDGHAQHQVTTTVIDKLGKIKSSITDVKIKGKNFATEKV